MPKTYTAAGTVVAGDVYTAAAHNIIATDVNNLIVPPAVRAYRATNLTSYTSNQAITWDAENYDTDGMHSTATNTERLTVNTAGIYMITLQVRSTWGGTLTAQAANIYVNGTSTAIGVQEVYGISTTIGGAFVNATAVGSFDVGTYFVGTYTFSGATGVAIQANANFGFAATWLGAVA